MPSPARVCIEEGRRKQIPKQPQLGISRPRAQTTLLQLFVCVRRNHRQSANSENAKPHAGTAIADLGTGGTRSLSTTRYKPGISSNLPGAEAYFSMTMKAA